VTVLPSSGDHVLAVAEHLRSAGILTTTSDLPPAGSGWQGAPGQSTYVGYARVTDVSGSPPTGTVDGVRDTMRFLYHVQSVGGGEVQAYRLRDRVHARMVDGTLTVPGRALLEPPRILLPGQTDSDHDGTVTEWVGWDQYRCETAPA
jgi:hypothetical protein